MNNGSTIATQQYTSNEASTLIKSNEKNEAAADDSSDLAKARRLLYVSHFFAQFSEAAWQFALILFLAAFTEYKSLFLISTYGVASGLSICLLGAKAGRFVDGSNRLFAASFFIWTENLSVLIATVLCYLLLNITPINNNTEEEEAAIVSESPSWTNRNFPHGALTPWSIFLLIGIHFWGSLASILDAGFLVAIERDWVVIMSHEVSGKTSDWLSETNVMMKQIDLTCRVVAPALAGFVIGAFDNSAHKGSDLTGAALLVGAVNVAALIVEYCCTHQIYHLVPKLAEMPRHAMVSRNTELDLHVHSELVSSNMKCRIMKLPSGLKLYMDQPVAWAGLGLSLL